MIIGVKRTLHGLLAAVPGANLLRVTLVVELGVNHLSDKLGVNLLGIVIKLSAASHS